MLTSITPLGERGRGQRWWLTASGLLVGHLVGGLLFGAVLGVVSMASHLVANPSSAVSALVMAAAILIAATADSLGWRLPGRRQVDERWLTKYRGWVYGLGFGIQLGAGFFTVVNTSLFVVLVVSAIFNTAWFCLLIGVLYGATRGAMAVLSARVHTVGDLKSLHQRLDRVERPSMWGGLFSVSLVAGVFVVSVLI